MQTLPSADLITFLTMRERIAISHGDTAIEIHALDDTILPHELRGLRLPFAGPFVPSPVLIAPTGERTPLPFCVVARDGEFVEIL